MLRPIDAYALNNALVSWYNDTEDETEKAILRRVMQMVVHAPTLTPPNEPLTMEQLREMDGEPVWVKTPGIPKYGCWVIVAGVDTEYGQRTLYCQGDYTCRNYGRDWIAYRRPPEGEADGK